MPNGRKPASCDAVQSSALPVAQKLMMSPLPANTFEAPMATTVDCGQFVSVTRPSVAVQTISLSSTEPPTVVGQVGSLAPDVRMDVACQVISEANSAVQVTPPSVTVCPAMTGHTGSELPDVATPACVATNTRPGG